jgi:hypothetical protein
VRRRAAFLFFFVFLRASPPVLEPALIAHTIVVDFDPTGIKTGGNGILQPVVMRSVVVVIMLSFPRYFQKVS